MLKRLIFKQNIKEKEKNKRYIKRNACIYPPIINNYLFNE